MSAGPSLALIGLRASGKSTVGRAIADRTGLAFTDLDDAVLEALDAPTVAEAWERDGEAAFRAAETRALRRLLAGGAQVLALGGGTPTAPGAADILRAASKSGGARVVYLRCEPDELRARLDAVGVGPDRPSLTGADPRDEIEAVFVRRDPLYTDLADAIVEGVTTLDGAIAGVERAWRGGGGGG